MPPRAPQDLEDLAPDRSLPRMPQLAPPQADQPPRILGRVAPNPHRAGDRERRVNLAVIPPERRFPFILRFFLAPQLARYLRMRREAAEERTRQAQAEEERRFPGEEENGSGSQADEEKGNEPNDQEGRGAPTSPATAQ
ncbi:unnamed protein product [Caenorhabditis sp. 36 PRJEB53466]|nr:unnamed protein product [Caenorhabditis sp. 36 PRJEB53466]